MSISDVHFGKPEPTKTPGFHSKGMVINMANNNNSGYPRSVKIMCFVLAALMVVGAVSVLFAVFS